ncbi:Transposon Tf2-9 polyprotein [Nosema granulosis]|uniref:Transposon Tf2-9 polyprotein n=1 Tax=Nosema granulosis TaxID=83296 RepID=A0A9P6KWS7_9MICR|nr:Transposon Tf2-9 polyprotein [Nosema granulosis]
MEEFLDENLTEKLCFLINNQDTDLINVLKRYRQKNCKFRYMKSDPAKLVIKRNVETIQSKGYSVPYKYLEEARAELRRLVEEDIIEESRSLFSSHAFFIRKKNNDLRLVIDFKGINKYIEDDAWTIPRIEECLYEMGSNNIFSQLDLKMDSTK